MRCLTCGTNQLCTWKFRGRNYCREHYDERKNAEMEVEEFLHSQQLQKDWDSLKHIPDDDFDRMLKQ
jgi:hypothetical protein